MVDPYQPDPDVRPRHFLIPIGHESLVVIDSETGHIKWKVQIFMPGALHPDQTEPVLRFSTVYDHIGDTIYDFGFGFTGDEQWCQRGDYELDTIIGLHERARALDVGLKLANDLALDYEERVPWALLKTLVQRASESHKMWQIEDGAYEPPRNLGSLTVVFEEEE